jgi:serine/threonine protein kinase/tetratricopeptide (TPR) repeat protein
VEEPEQEPSKDQVTVTDSRTPTKAPTLPDQIGPYRILSILGEGGMGTVYEASESGAVRRHVALKVVRAGLSSNEIRARFDAERQALALMDHAGIARVLAAGETPAGDPYFAMELVKGLPILEYCDSRRLSTDERLELFTCVCQAVHHAHQKGVIHRDLKPSNILVMEQDGKPVPKVIDFGIAKALGPRLTDLTLHTAVGVPIGTVAYMSPEQAESSGMDVDTRSDIYSLGVILYQLLVGSLPAEPSGQAMHAFIYRLASRTTSAPRPSVRYTQLGAAQKMIADARQTNPDHLGKVLKGDLDWIVMKSLEPERNRRYDTAIAFSNDIERYLAHETVAARPPTAGYRAAKFMRRHRAGVAASAVATVALLTGAAFTGLSLVRATRAERAAASEAASAKQVADFLVELFRVSDPGESRGNQVTARELLDRGAEKSITELSAQPAIQGRMMHTIGTAYASLGLYQAARQQLQNALAARIRALGPNDPAVSETEVALADAMASHGDLDSAEVHYRRAFAIHSRLDQEHPAYANALGGFAALRYRQGRYLDADSLYQRAIALNEQAEDVDSAALAAHLSGLGIVYWAQQRLPEAERLFRRGLAIQERRLGADHPTVARLVNNLGGLVWTQGKYDDAARLYERARVVFERTLDPMHPDMASISNNLGETYWKLGKLNEAEPLFRRALVIKEARLARDHPSIATTLNGLGGMLRDAGRADEAEAAYRRALSIREKAFGRQHETTLETVADYGRLLRATGRGPLADALLSRYATER